MNYKIEKWPAFKVAGFSTKVETKKAFEVVPHIWEKAWSDGTMKKFIENFPDYRPAGFLGIAAVGQNDEEEMQYIIGMTTHVDDPECSYAAPPNGMEEFSYPEATWAVINADGKLPGVIQNAYKEFYEWLPKSNYREAGLPIIECYKNEESQEIWIAVESK